MIRNLPQLGTVETPSSINSESCSAVKNNQSDLINSQSFGENLIKLAPGERRKQTADETCKKVAIVKDFKNTVC